jgi:hypothetical protein
MNWINLNEKLPEDMEELIIKPTDELSPFKTKRVLALTDTGSITDNRRLKMQVGEKEWTWFMGYQDETVVKWAVFDDPCE